MQICIRSMKIHSNPSPFAYYVPSTGTRIANPMVAPKSMIPKLSPTVMQLSSRLEALTGGYSTNILAVIIMGAPQSYRGVGGTRGLDQRGEGVLEGLLGLCH